MRVGVGTARNIRGEQSAQHQSLFNMQAMLIVFLLTIGASAIAVAQDSPNISVPPVLPPDVSLPIVPVPVNESLIFSQDLDPDYTPCR